MFHSSARGFSGTNDLGHSLLRKSCYNCALVLKKRKYSSLLQNVKREQEMVQTMTQSTEMLESYYQKVQKQGKLRSLLHAQRWSTAVLKTLGFHLDKGTRRALAQALPKPLADDLTRVFWLLHFPHKNLPAQEFYEQVARRSGNTDVAFARYPTTAVFAAVKELISPELSQRVGRALSPEVRAVWEQA